MPDGFECICMTLHYLRGRPSGLDAIKIQLSSMYGEPTQFSIIICQAQELECNTIPFLRSILFGRHRKNLFLQEYMIKKNQIKTLKN